MNTRDNFEQQGIYMDQHIKNELQSYSEKAENLKKQGRYIDQFHVLEKAFKLKINVFSEDSQIVQQASDELCELCNLIAMNCLQRQVLDTCYNFLNRAEKLLKHSDTFKSMTKSNFSCYYRNKGMAKTALKYLQEALEIEIMNPKSTSRSEIHLNLCAVLSQLKKHEQALEHCLMSIVFLQDFFFKLPPKPQDQQDQHNNQEHQEEEEQEEENEEAKAAQQNEKLSTLFIAYYNMGVELEFLKRFPEAVQAYQKAIDISQSYYGDQNQYLEKFKEAFISAQNQMINQMQKPEPKQGNFFKPEKKLPNIRMGLVQQAYQNQNFGTGGVTKKGITSQQQFRQPNLYDNGNQQKRPASHQGQDSGQFKTSSQKQEIQRPTTSGPQYGNRGYNSYNSQPQDNQRVSSSRKGQQSPNYLYSSPQNFNQNGNINYNQMGENQNQQQQHLHPQHQLHLQQQQQMQQSQEMQQQQQQSELQRGNGGENIRQDHSPDQYSPQ